MGNNDQEEILDSQPGDQVKKFNEKGEYYELKPDKKGKRGKAIKKTAGEVFKEEVERKDIGEIESFEDFNILI